MSPPSHDGSDRVLSPPLVNGETQVYCILLQFVIRHITLISEIKIIREISRILAEIIGKDTPFSAGFAQLLEYKHKLLSIGACFP